jgi:hypothetical protein
MHHNLQTRSDIETLIADLEFDNHDGAHDTYIAWLNRLLAQTEA